MPDVTAFLPFASILGAVTGTFALLWRVIDEFGAFVRISVKAETPKDGWVTVLTGVENKGFRPKKIKYALLLVGPESDDPVETARVIARTANYSGKINHTNDLKYFVVNKSVRDGDRAIIPLAFYYDENVRISDETLTYRAPINIEAFIVGAPYSVRFFIFNDCHLHRSTHDVFILEKPKSATA